MKSRPPEATHGPSGEPASTEAKALAAEIASLRRELETSERERALSADREAQLRAELQHRVRNTLAIIRSISERTFGADDDNEPAHHFRGRLDAIARFEVRRGGGPRPGCDLEEMLRDELRIFEFDERIELVGPEVLVPYEIARLLGLAIHELATNSIKFGALSTSDTRARLAVRWTFARARLKLAWEERGVPVVATAPVRVGFGQEYIEQALPYQIDAETRFELRPGGIGCTIEVPFPAGEEPDGWPRAWV